MRIPGEANIQFTQYCCFIWDAFSWESCSLQHRFISRISRSLATHVETQDIKYCFHDSQQNTLFSSPLFFSPTPGENLSVPSITS